MLVIGLLIEPCVMCECCVQMFSLPSLKTAGKCRIPSQNGVKLRQANVVEFRSRSGETFSYLLFSWRCLHDTVAHDIVRDTAIDIAYDAVQNVAHNTT